ncbi:hypothetical protein [Hydrogenimonas cancrithermarum]|uniref:General secretion pathway protein K n=1 Tax=Hydrogenimonas cancrithermarum TaxID=2993563 RepID=A0ABM8FM50_9BACT|nr:hypothetical protein [Hydrogenimonas cancrithermarum]BDY13449.1 hypothetical protein HCR_17610 [Hydrogenimonas cancrithermarum]
MRRGIVLFITLGILLLLSSIVFLFLQQSGALKKSVRKNIDIIQTNLLLSDMSDFLKSQNFTQDDIFYGSGIPVSLDLGPVSGTITLSSARDKIDINALLGSVQKEQQALDGLLLWMENRHVKAPSLLLAILLDSYDTDSYERERGSEIRNNRPWFQNGQIANSRAMETILQTYTTLSGDANLTLESWEETFGYEGAALDLNYATSEQLRLLYPDFPPAVIARLAAHDERYAKAEDLPIDEEYKASLLTVHFGITPTLETDTLDVRITFSSTQECSGSMGFWMGVKKKKITHLSLSPVTCE